MKEIRIEKIALEGNRTVDRSLIVNTLQVREGEEYLPPVLRQRVQASVNALHKLGLFQDIKVDMEDPDTTEGNHLIFVLTELPTLAHAGIEGNKKIKKDDIKDAMDLLDGQVYSRSAKERNRQKILDLYHDKGYLLAEVEAEEGDEASTGRKTVTYKISEGKKVRVRYIAFEGNRQVADKKLRKRLGTKEDRWWRDGEYKEDEFRLGLDSRSAPLLNSI
jgi:outer membrane protein insertion porin family